MRSKKSETCYSFLNDQFQLCSFIRNQTPMAYIEHIPSKKRRKFTCIHSATMIGAEDAARFKTDPVVQAEALESLEMIGEEEYERYGITCETRLQGINSYLQGIATLFNENEDIGEVFDQLVMADQSIGSADYSLNGEIAKFVARNMENMEKIYKKFLFKKHKIGTKDAYCKGLIMDIEKFYSGIRDEDVQKREEILLEANCICPKVIKSLSVLKNIQENCFDIVEGLFLYGNSIKTFPKKILKLSKLQKLYISENKISTIPKGIGNLVYLKKLLLDSNEIKEIPKEIGNLQRLEALFVDNNLLNTIPEEIGNLPNLRRIDFTNNPISKLPESLCDKLRNNQIITNIDHKKLCRIHQLN